MEPLFASGNRILPNVKLFPFFMGRLFSLVYKLDKQFFLGENGDFEGACLCNSRVSVL